VLAGTQGMRNHQKTDRMLRVAHQLGLPVVLFAEGGGGRPGDTDMPIVAGLNNHTFSRFAGLSGKVPVVGIAHGRCFAGNAALLGCCDVIIATAASNIGMGGPAMIEGGGLGSYKPEDIGPSRVQAQNGVIEIGGDGTPEPFNQALMGASKGESRRLVLPAVAHTTEEGVHEHPEQTFDIVVTEVREKTAPPLDDAFAHEAPGRAMPGQAARWRLAVVLVLDDDHHLLHASRTDTDGRGPPHPRRGPTPWPTGPGT